MIGLAGESCNSVNFGSGPFKGNSCNTVLHTGGQEGALPTFLGTFDIVCPVGKTLEAVMGSCVVQIFPETGLQARFYSGLLGTTTPITVRGEAYGLKWKSSGPFSCGSHEGEEMNWFPSWQLTGTYSFEEKTVVPLRVSSGGASIVGEAPTQPKFTAAAYPSFIGTSGTNSFTFATPGGSVACANTRFWS